MPKYKQITDERMFRVADYVIKNKVRDISTAKAFAEAIGSHGSNLSNIRSGTQSFTTEHILQACKLFNISADYIFGLTSEMQRKVPARAIDKLKAAVLEIEAQLKLK